jgi:hypothetical protein
VPGQRRLFHGGDHNLGRGREENAMIHDVRDGYGFGTTYNLLQIQRGIRDYFQIFLPLYS